MLMTEHMQPVLRYNGEIFQTSSGSLAYVKAMPAPVPGSNSPLYERAPIMVSLPYVSLLFAKG